MSIGAALLLMLAAEPAGSDGQAAFALGRAYKLGDGVAADAGEAARWFERAARAGHRKAGAELGLVLFQDGKGREALPWLRAAAEAGDPRAQYALGTILFAGKLVPADPAQAKSWMARAARAGLPAAKEALAIMSKPLPAPEPIQIAMIEPKASGVWLAQLGAFAVPDNARRYWRQVSSGVAAGLRASFPTQGQFTLLRVAPFASRAEAARFCAGQRKHGRDCLEVRGRS